MKFYSISMMATAAFALVATIPAAHGQGADPHAVLEQGAKVTGLTGEDVPAYHLKATYTLYDIHKNTPTASGTMEEWYSKPGVWHRIYTEKKLSGSEWSTSPIKQFKLKDDKIDIGGRDNQVARPLLDPVRSAANYKSSVEMSLQAGTFAGMVLDCVSAANPAQAAGGGNPDILFPRLCFNAKDSTLQITTTSDTMTNYSEFKQLGNRQVATKVEVKPYNRLGTAIDVTLLEPLAAGDQAQLNPPGNAIELPYAHQPSDPPLVPVKITECAYPMEARNNQEHGVVSVPVVIQKNGSVKSNGYPLGPPHLAQSAMDCITGYKFEPFKLDGVAVDTSDVIMYDFENKPFTPSMVTIASQPGAKK